MIVDGTTLADGTTPSDLGAALWDLPTRGGGFREIRERLEREMGVA